MSDFMTNGAAVLPPVKSDVRVPTGSVGEWDASDANDLRQAALDLRTQAILETQERVAADSAIIASGAQPANVSLAPVTPPGRTATRSVQDWFSAFDGQVINVKDVAYGAKGDGATDDRAAIQAAIDAVAAGGGCVFFPPGVYLLTSRHPSGLHANILQMFKSNLTFQGCGASSMIKLGTGAYTGLAFNVFSNYDNAVAANFGTYSDIAFKDLFFDLNGATNSYTSSYPGPRVVIQFGDTSRASVVGCTFDNMNVNNTIAVGRPLRTTSDFIVTGCTFLEPTDGDTYNLDHSTIYANSTRSIVSGNSFLATTNRGRAMSTMCELHASGSTFQGNTGKGYRQAVYVVSDVSEHASPQSNFIVTDNVADDNNLGFATLWTDQSGSMSDVLIARNVASMNLTQVNVMSGDLASKFVATTRLGTFTRVRIEDNVAVFNDAKANASRGVITYGNLTDFSVARNHFTGCKYGVQYTIANGADNITVLRASIVNNDFVECGDGTDLHSTIECGTGASVITDLTISGNRLWSSTPLNRPFYLQAGTKTRLRFLKNLCNFVPGTALLTVNGGQFTDSVYEVESTVSADRGDNSVTLVNGKDATVQRFATALTGNKTVALPSTNNGNGFTYRIVRTGLGAFTLDVGGLKTIPSATAAFVDVTYDGSAWRLTGYGTL